MRDVERNIFAGGRAIGMHAEQKRWIEQQMVALLEAGRLYLTEIMLQPEANLAGEVIFGLGRDENTKMMAPNWATDPRLKRATVRLESIEYDPANPLEPKPAKRSIVYKDGMRQETNFLLTAATHGPAVDGGPYKHMVDNVVDLETHSADVPLREAWLILKQKGMGVVQAVRQDHRQRAWLVREVPPEELAERNKTTNREQRAKGSSKAQSATL